MKNTITQLAIYGINFYQKFLSPYKGFSCAYRVSTNGLSCSAYGKKVIQRHGFFIGFKLLQRRFEDCRWHSQWLKEHQFEGIYLKKTLHKQRGVIDCDCSGVDLPDMDCDLPDCNGKFCRNISFCDCAPADCSRQQRFECCSRKSNKYFDKKRHHKNLSLKKEPVWQEKDS